MALVIILVIAFVVGLPIVAFSALSKSNTHENELVALRSLLRDLSEHIDRLRGEVEWLRSQLGVPAAPIDEAPKPFRSGEAAAETPSPEAVSPPAASTAAETRRRKEEGFFEASTPPQEPDELAGFAHPPRSGENDIENLEEALTSRWMVWLGAVSIALGGTFLVKYAIDEGLLGPAARCTLGFLLGVGLAIAGEWLRQRPLQRAIASIRPNYVPAALTASGLFVAFASVYAAYTLYSLLPSFVAFAALAVIALMAVGLSLLHGPFVALLGVFGGFLTPALVTTPNPSAWGLMLYLLVVEAACLAVARFRFWWGFALATLAGAALWPLAWMSEAGPWKAGDEVPLGLFLLITAIAYFVIRPRTEGDESREDWFQEFTHLDIPATLVWAAAGVAFFTLFVLVQVFDHSVASLILFGLAALLSLVAGRKEARFDGLAVIAAATTVAMVATLPVPASVILPRPLPGAPLIPPELVFFATTSFVFGLLFAAGGFIALWGAKRPAVWAGVSAAVPVLLLVLAYQRIVDFNVDLSWAGLALGLAAVNVFAAERMERYRSARGLEISLGFYAAAAVACLSLAAAMSLRQAWLTVALSAQLPMLGWISRRIRGQSIPIIAAIIAVIVLVRLLLNFNIFDYPLSSNPAFSWVLYGYGIPALAFFGAARLFGGRQTDPLITLLKAGGLAFSVLLVSFQIRLLIAGSLNSPVYSLLEQSLQSIAWLSIGAMLAVRHRTSAEQTAFYGSRILLAGAAAQVLLLQLLVSNPLLSREYVGEYPLINVLFLAYAVPAVYALCLAQLEQARDSRLAAASAVTGFVLLFVYISLEIRRAFQGPYLFGFERSNAEMYTYSAIWLAYAGALLGLGILSGRKVLRHAALAVLLVTVLKVFLFDMAGLTGLYRAASFLGLGLSLVGIGYLYQRFVFRPPGESGPTHALQT